IHGRGRALRPGGSTALGDPHERAQARSPYVVWRRGHGGFLGKGADHVFWPGLSRRTDPYRVTNPDSWTYVGVGAFQLLRRSAYEAAGTHRRLAMEVVDDMKVGKIVKQAGFRSS